eukprot:scaffold130349_cov63-Phaeocystis_antarctica.AAC.4
MPKSVRAVSTEPASATRRQTARRGVGSPNSRRVPGGKSGPLHRRESARMSSTTPAYCERLVAMAAPATPQAKRPISSGSSTRLMAVPMSAARSGVAVSRAPRKVPCSARRAREAGVPTARASRYARPGACSALPCGTPSAPSSGEAKHAMPAPMTAPPPSATARAEEATAAIGGVNTPRSSPTSESASAATSEVVVGERKLNDLDTRLNTAIATAAPANGPEPHMRPTKPVSTSDATGSTARPASAGSPIASISLLTEILLELRGGGGGAADSSSGRGRDAVGASAHAS